MVLSYINKVYDIETYKNLFTAIFKNADTGEIETVEISERKNELSKLKSIVNTDNLRLIGYNSHMFDDIIIRYMIENNIDDPMKIYNMVQYIIGSQKDKSYSIYNDKKIKPYLWANTFSTIDLMKIPALDKLFVGLKQVAVLLKHDRIQDLPIHYEDLITVDQIDLILEYNLNDVLITEKLYNKLLPDIELRAQVSKQYDIKVESASRTKIAKDILNKAYFDAAGNNDFKDLRSYYSYINLGDCVFDSIKFKSKEMNNLLTKIKNTKITKTKGSLDYTVKYGKKTYQLGIGGLHSVDESGYFVSTDNCKIIDCDVGSFYPRIMTNYKVKPKHLSDEFLIILEDITDKRLLAKKNKDMITADTLKITINSIYGLLGFDYYWLKDDKALTTVTINGQLFLLMLIERFEDNDIEVISANTDGITCNVKNNQEALYYEICNSWQRYTKFELEYAFYDIYARRDVNSYIVKTNNGKVKEKGIFLREIDITKGYDKPIVSHSLYEYFINNKPVEETMYNHPDILDFCSSQKVGYQFRTEHHYIDNEGNKHIDKLQKTNRYYVTKFNSAIVKVNNETEAINKLCNGYNLALLNDYTKQPMDNYRIDYNYYINEVNSIINLIKPKVIQQQLF